MRSAQRLESRIFDILAYFLVIVMSVFMVYPFLYIISISLSDAEAVISGSITFYPKGFTLEPYKYIFKLPNVVNGYLYSVIYTATGTAISVVLTVLCAYPLSKNRLPARPAFIVFILVTMFVSGGLVPTYILVKMLGMINSVWAIVVPSAMNTFLMFVAIAFFKSIPNDLEEASVIDGAGDLAVLTKVMLPLSKPILATLSLFYAVGNWNSWFSAVIYLNDTKMYPIQLILRNVMAGTAIQSGASATVIEQLSKAGVTVEALNYALIVAVILPIIFLYPFVQKYFIQGAMIGSLKG